MSRSSLTLPTLTTILLVLTEPLDVLNAILAILPACTVAILDSMSKNDIPFGITSSPGVSIAFMESMLPAPGRPNLSLHILNRHQRILGRKYIRLYFRFRLQVSFLLQYLLQEHHHLFAMLVSPVLVQNLEVTNRYLRQQLHLRLLEH